MSVRSRIFGTDLSRTIERLKIGQRSYVPSRVVYKLFYYGYKGKSRLVRESVVEVLCSFFSRRCHKVFRPVD